MRLLIRRALPLLAAFAWPHFSAVAASTPAKSVTVPFVLDNNRVFVELAFALPDGTIRKTLAFVDTGNPDFDLSKSLVDALQIEHGKDLRVRLGDLPLKIDPDVQAEGFDAKSMLPGLQVESNLPAKVLRHYTLILDYAKRTLTLAEPGTLQLDGTRVLFSLNPKTGLLAVHATVDGQDYSMAIDNGSAYTWISQDVVSRWTQKHPDWQRGVGAVGHANMNGSVPELSGVDIRLPAMSLGSLQLTQIGALGVSSGWDPKTMPRFFDWYSQKTPGPVVAFIGGNVLKAFRVAIDYATGATYWLRQQPDDAHDLDQVGITLGPAEDGTYSVLQIAQKNGQKSVTGVLPGDVLLSVDGLPVTGATQRKVLDALHGKPGDSRKLRLQRKGEELVVTARVARF
jgi:hypothetical protein